MHDSPSWGTVGHAHPSRSHRDQGLTRSFQRGLPDVPPHPPDLLQASRSPRSECFMAVQLHANPHHLPQILEFLVQA